MFARGTKMTVPGPDQALRGRPTPMPVPARHEVLGTPMQGPWPEDAEVAVSAWAASGAEQLFWQLDGVHSTAAGYAGGHTANPTYQEVCTGLTGHTEVVQVVFFPARIPYQRLLKAFWDNHDPTQGMRQGNDVGTQYRSAVYATSDAQLPPRRPPGTRSRRWSPAPGTARSPPRSASWTGSSTPRTTISSTCTRTLVATATPARTA